MSKIKKMFIIFLSLVVLTLILVQPIFAMTGTITGSRVRVRKEANADSEILLNVVKDDEVEVIEPSGDWYKVKVKGNTGYIHKDYIEVEDSKPMEAIDKKDEEEVEKAISEATQKKEEKKEVVIPVDTEQTTIKDTAVYMMPLISSIKSDSLSKGKKVTALETLGGWIKISYDKKIGWVRVSNLVEETAAAEPSEPEETTPEKPKEPEKPKPEQKVGYINATTVNLRKEASTSSGIITQLDRGTKIDIISTKGGWHEIKVDNMKGYVAESLVVYKLEDITTSRSGETTTRTIENVEIVPASAPASSSSSSKGQEIVDYAMTFLKAKYASGGNGPDSFDCSGFTAFIYKKFGISLSRTTAGQAAAGTEVAKKDLKLGDLVVFNDDANKKIGHTGIYIGNNSFIHASNPNPYPKGGVKITSMSDSYYEVRYVTSRRLI